jgi:protein-disulfide isomerase-like protein with CxxC motif
LRHRYGSGLDWKLGMIGLAENYELYVEKGFTGTLMATHAASFSRKYGMPVTTAAKPRPLATWPACRTVVATRLHQPELEAQVHRALQVAWFTTTALLDQDDALLEVLSKVDGLDSGEIVQAAANDSDVADAFASDREIARSAKGSPTEAQNKHAMDGDLSRYTAPSLLMTGTDGRTLEAGGFQPLEAYDVIIANADPTLPRHKTETAAEALEASTWPLAVVEVASILAPPLTPPDIEATEVALIELAASGNAERIAAGNGAFYSIH